MDRTQLQGTRLDRLLERIGIGFVDPDEEAAFADLYVRGSVGVSQVFLLIGGAVFYGFFVCDKIIDPVGGDLTHMIRGLIVAPFMFGCAALLFTQWGRHRIEFVSLAAVAVAQVALCFIYGLLAHGYNYATVGFILLFIGMTSAFAIRSKYLAFASLFALATTVTGHLWFANAYPGWLYINALAIVCVIAFGSISAYIREHAARRQFVTDRALHASRARVDQLLHSILPRDVIQRIQGGETSIAETLGEVSIIFAELVGFDELARRVSPTDLLDVLNALFSGFDLEAERYGIDRIKTIGDAYMAIGGLVRGEASHDHAENAADFALAMRRAVRGLREETGYPIDVRIGLHVGSVIAGVIGVRRPAFDCWGESVNLAARLESSAPAGGIMLSETTFWRLRGKFVITQLEDIELKGFGQTKAYLLGKRAGPAAKPRHAAPTSQPA